MFHLMLCTHAGFARRKQELSTVAKSPAWNGMEGAPEIMT